MPVQTFAHSATDLKLDNILLGFEDLSIIEILSKHKVTIP